MADRDKDELDALVANAQAKRDAQDAARVAVRDDRVRDGERATSALGRFTGAGWRSLINAIAIVTAIFAVYGVAQPTLHYSITHNPYPNPVIFICEVAAALVAAMIGLRYYAHAAVRRAVTREQAWARSLPFALVDHLRLLGSSRGVAALDFVGAAPDLELFKELAFGLTVANARLEADVDDHRLQLEIAFTTNPADGGHPRWRAWHAVVDGLLLPLHARFPLRAVRVR